MSKVATAPSMGTKVGIVRFDGKITLLSRLAQITESAKQPNGTLLQIHRRDKHLIDNQVVSFPGPSQNTIRSMVRDNIARDITDALAEKGQKVGYQDLIVLYCGGGGAEGKDLKAAEGTAEEGEGQKDKKHGKKALSPSDLIAAQTDAKNRNVVLSLLGASALRAIIAGKTVIGEPILICRETVDAGLVDLEKIAEQTSDLAFGRDNGYIDIKQYVRKDDMTNPEVFEMLSEEGLGEMISFEAALADKKAKKNNDDEPQKGSATSRQMIFSVETVIPGAKYYHYNILKNVASIELGAFLSALKRFSIHPYIGGHSSRGCGRIALNYTITINGEIHGEVAVDDNGFSLNGASDVVLGAMEDYRAYLEQVTADSISVQLK